VGAILSFSGPWGVPYPGARFGLPVEKAALVCSLLLACFAFGSPISVLISDRLGKRKPPYVTCVVVAAAGWAAVVLIPALPLAAVVTILAITGFCTGVGALSYAVGRGSARPEISGTMTGAVITGIMIGPAILQPVTGILLDLNWAGVRIYDVAAFNTAFLPMVGWTIGAALLVPWLKETYCGEQRGENQ